jgi:hypothetical protein
MPIRVSAVSCSGLRGAPEGHEDDTGGCRSPLVPAMGATIRLILDGWEFMPTLAEKA